MVQNLGLAFGRTDFSRIFIFGPLDFFADFVADFFLLIFVGKSAQKNPPGKPPQNLYNENPGHIFLQRGRANRIEKQGSPEDGWGMCWEDSSQEFY